MVLHHLYRHAGVVLGILLAGGSVLSVIGSDEADADVPLLIVQFQQEITPEQAASIALELVRDRSRGPGRVLAVRRRDDIYHVTVRAGGRVYFILIDASPTAPR